MEDYYKLLGVQPDDERETIRDAYRAQKADLDAKGGDDARAKASRLNRAWNVLSDNTQRARYDDQLADAKADGTVESDDSGDADDAPGRGRGGRDRPARQPRQPIFQETEINGVPLASNKDRGFALAIDGFILFALLIASQVLFPGVAEALQEKEWTAYDDQSQVVEDARDDLDAKDKALDTAKDNDDPADDAAAQREHDAADAKLDAETDKLSDLFSKVQPSLRLLTVVWTLVALAITVVPSAIGGRTLGKRLRGITLRRESGDPAGWGASLRHFGLPIVTMGIVGLVAFGFIQIAGLVWLFGVTSFARNPRRQGWHDRFAKTIVAAD